MTIKLPKTVDLAAAQAGFVARQAGRDLAEPPADTAARAPLRQLLAGHTGGQAGDQAGDQAGGAMGGEIGGPIPIGLLRLRRHAARARALARSPAARAAHTADEVARKIGAYTLRLIDEGDVVFLTLAVTGAENTAADTQVMPTQLEVFLDTTGEHILLDLPKPIGGTIQLGLARSQKKGKDLLNILGHPEAEIILS